MPTAPDRAVREGARLIRASAIGASATWAPMTCSNVGARLASASRFAALWPAAPTSGSGLSALPAYATVDCVRAPA